MAVPGNTILFGQPPLINADLLCITIDVRYVSLFRLANRFNNEASRLVALFYVELGKCSVIVHFSFGACVIRYLSFVDCTFKVKGPECVLWSI